jgi:hypothetical protein
VSTPGTATDRREAEKFDQAPHRGGDFGLDLVRPDARDACGDLAEHALECELLL